MELECVLLGLISMHDGVTGYELNRIMRDSTGYLISTSLSHIYPALKKLREQGLVSAQDIPIKNRLAKKVYRTTPAGEEALWDWLTRPIEENALDARPFYLKMAFSPLMSKQTILGHLDREIKRLEQYHQELERNIQLEMEYLDKKKFNPEKAALLWGGINLVTTQIDALRLSWLKDWSEKIDSQLID